MSIYKYRLYTTIRDDDPVEHVERSGHVIARKRVCMG